jgi:hypothetical protein
MITKVLSLGSSGAERAAIDAALARPLTGFGGYVMQGRLVDDGALDERYISQRFSDVGLVETSDTSYEDLAKKLIKDADGVLILRSGKHTEKPRLVLRKIRELQHEEISRTYISADPAMTWHLHEVLEWVADQRIRHIMITGPVASKRVGIYENSMRFISDLLSQDFIRSNWGISPYRKV